MKLALIAPPKYQWIPYIWRSGYHFVLAQYLDDPNYAGMYTILRDAGHFLILDNGAAEFGKSIDLEKLRAAYDLLQPDEIILPDSLGKGVETMQLTHAAVHMFPRKKRAVVPQGRNWIEWEMCLNKLVSYGCATICVPKLYEGYKGGRLKALKIIQKNRFYWDHNIHLLGCYDNPLEEIRRVRDMFPWVRGIDTAAPIAYAQQGKKIDDPERASLDWDNPSADHTLINENLRGCLLACLGVDTDAHNDN